MQHQLLHKYFGEVLPYLEIKKQENTKVVKQNVEMPDVIGIDLIEAKKILKELNLEIEINGEETKESKVINQLPRKGIQIQEGTKVILYTN